MGSARRANLRSLQAFEVVSRHMSVSKAADELGITQSAVSHHIKQLTDEVGEKLLAKNGRGVALTTAGERLARRLQSAFSDIDRSLAETIGEQRGIVRIAVCSSFAPGWLIPRLPRLYEAHPAFDFQLCMYASDPELTDAVADAFVTIKPRQSGFSSTLIMPERLVAVAHARLTHRFGFDLPLITTDVERIGDDWREYFSLSGANAAGSLPDRWLLATHYILARDMVRAGLGAALVPDFLIADDVENETLVLVRPERLATHEDYYFSVKDNRKSEPGLEALSRWFRQESAADRRKITETMRG